MPRHDVLKEASLPKCREWQEWLNYHLASLPSATGFDRLLSDTVIELHHLICNAARRLRSNPGWDIQGTMRDDTVRLEHEARAALARWQMHRPRRGLSPDVLLWCETLEGALSQQVRLGREIDQMRAEGALDIAVTADRRTGQLIEEKFA